MCLLNQSFLSPKILGPNFQVLCVKSYMVGVCCINCYGDLLSDLDLRTSHPELYLYYAHTIHLHIITVSLIIKICWDLIKDMII